MQNKNGTKLTATPLSGVGISISGKQFNRTVVETPEQSMVLHSNYITRYWTYGDGYTVDEKKGITLTGVNTCIYKDCYDDLVGKYLVSNNISSNSSINNISKETKGLTTIYRVDTVGENATDNVTLTQISVTQKDIEERILTTTPDDYGTSYYFRGDVVDNYLEFNNMCWRIVRIEGDGSVKITLAAQKKCSLINVETDISTAFIGEGDYGYIESDSSHNYENLENRTTSMKYKFDEWFNNNFAGVSNKLKTSEICLGDLTILYDDFGYSYYDNHSRLYDRKSPSLVCPSQGTKTTPSKIFPLTVDEVAFAGGIASYYDETLVFYLNDNAFNWWWTVTPAAPINNAFYYDGFIVGDGAFSIADNSASLRPAVSLITGSVISKGDGTIDNPYVIE